jgi:hypothetical protein
MQVRYKFLAQRVTLAGERPWFRLRSRYVFFDITGSGKAGSQL